MVLYQGGFSETGFSSKFDQSKTKQTQSRAEDRYWPHLHPVDNKDTDNHSALNCNPENIFQLSEVAIVSSFFK